MVGSAARRHRPERRANPVTFFGLVGGNIRSRPLRAVLTAGAVAIAVMAVLALGVLTASLKETATEILKVGNADFTISQKHTDDIINSTIDQKDIDAIGKDPGRPERHRRADRDHRLQRREPARHRGRTAARRRRLRSVSTSSTGVPIRRTVRTR